MIDHRTAARLACGDLLGAYAIAVDEGDASALVALFAPDGTIRRGDLTLTGTNALPRILDGRPADLVMRHHVTTTDIRVTGSAAEGRSYYILYRGRGSTLPLEFEAPFSIGDWHSRFVHSEAGWRLSFLEIRRVFVRAAPPAGR